jgi:hypothetical protein
MTRDLFTPAPKKPKLTPAEVVSRLCDICALVDLGEDVDNLIWDAINDAVAEIEYMQEQGMI